MKHHNTESRTHDLFTNQTIAQDNAKRAVPVIVPTVSASSAEPKHEAKTQMSNTTSQLPTADKRLKIVVYAIACNESSFVNRWVDSMQEADAIVVLDTGSRDNTIDLMKARGVQVEQQIFTPWRFDTSRNASIDLAIKLHPDADLLVCTDIDEYFIAGWRDKLEAAWKEAVDNAKRNGTPEPTTAQYEYVWGFNPDGSDGTKFWYEKIHTPQSGARWTHPVHEILDYSKPKIMVSVPGMRLEHHADPMKSRAQYLALLEMSVQESPQDDRNMHYLGREYMFRGMWQKSIDTLIRHLNLPTARWNAERAASMRFIARCYGELNNGQAQELWLWRAVGEAPDQREAPMELAEFYNKQNAWPMLVLVCEICLSRKSRVMSYLTRPEAWGSRPWDLYSVGLWYVGRKQESMNALEEALKINPNDERILNNKKVMQELMKK